MPRRFRAADALDELQPGPFQPIQLPTHLNLIVYARQSTQAQVLNHATSTEMQTADLIEIGIRYGWSREQCLLIDDDLGVSGTLGIDERLGLTKVMERIDQQQSRAVLVVNEDRLFRDESMIQVNVFIKFMREHNAYVLTPSMVYNFAERFHVKMFREKAEYAAAYITDYVRERLIGARRKKALKGLYDGRPIAPGYRVDYDKRLPDGSENPAYRRYVLYEPHAAVVRRLAEVMVTDDLSITELYRYALEHRLVFPEWEAGIDARVRSRVRLQPVAGGLFYASVYGLYSLFTNPVYIGHWLVGGRIAQRQNHPAILDEDTFYTLFERLSTYDLNGELNAKRNRYRAYPANRVVRGPDSAGMLLGLLYDVSSEPPLPVTYQHHTANYHRQTEPVMYYACVENTPGPKPQRWSIQAAVLDRPVSERFLNRLRRSQVEYDPAIYQEQAAIRQNELRARHKVLETQQREIQEQMEGNLRAMTLPGLTPDEMNYFLQRKRSLTRDLDTTTARLVELRSQQEEAQEMSQVFATLDDLLANWSQLSARQQRRYLTRFIEMIGIRVGTTGYFDIWIYWKHTFDAALDAAEIETLRIRLARARPTEWNDERNAILLEHYLLPQVDLMKHLPECTWGAICRQMNRLGLDRRGDLTALGRWPELKAIRDNCSWNDWLIEHPGEVQPTPPERRPHTRLKWTPEEDSILRDNLHLPRLELMKLLPDRTWGSIHNHCEQLGLPRVARLLEAGHSPNAGFGKGCPIPIWMSYHQWLEHQSSPITTDDTPAPEAAPFGINTLLDNLMK